LRDGFRPDKTPNLQSIVETYVNDNQSNILNNAFFWWKQKMIYAIYKYEIHKHANVREVMKGTISVEHILPQDWIWIRKDNENLKNMSEELWNDFAKKIDGRINGIGNLLLITPEKNASVGNSHPADKKYHPYQGGTYEEHNQNREKWRSPENWYNIIDERGKKIFTFMLENLIKAV
jgi:hypothetical protein